MKRDYLEKIDDVLDLLKGEVEKEDHEMRDYLFKLTKKILENGIINEIEAKEGKAK